MARRPRNNVFCFTKYLDDFIVFSRVMNDVRERSAPKIEVTRLRSTRDHRECTREKFEETSQRPVRQLLSLLAGNRAV